MKNKTKGIGYDPFPKVIIMNLFFSPFSTVFVPISVKTVSDGDLSITSF